MKKQSNLIRHITALCGMAAFILAAAVPANATGLQNSVVYTGTAALIADVMTVLTILCPTFCGVAAIYFAIRRGMADEQDGKMWTRRITTAIVCGVLGGLIAGIIALGASYYAG